MPRRSGQWLDVCGAPAWLDDPPRIVACQPCELSGLDPDCSRCHGAGEHEEIEPDPRDYGDDE